MRHAKTAVSKYTQTGASTTCGPVIVADRGHLILPVLPHVLPRRMGINSWPGFVLFTSRTTVLVSRLDFLLHCSQVYPQHLHLSPAELTLPEHFTSLSAQATTSPLSSSASRRCGTFPCAIAYTCVDIHVLADIVAADIHSLFLSWQCATSWQHVPTSQRSPPPSVEDGVRERRERHATADSASAVPQSPRLHRAPFVRVHDIDWYSLLPLTLSVSWYYKFLSTWLETKLELSIPKTWTLQSSVDLDQRWSLSRTCPWARWNCLFVPSQHREKCFGLFRTHHPP